MPYITPMRRFCVEPEQHDVREAGELNYQITRLCDMYLASAGVGVKYRTLNEVIGVLECAKLELYRRIAAPYEDNKKEINGDVYTCV